MTATDPPIRPLREVLDEVTEDQLRKALTASRGSVPVTAEILQISTDTVYRLIRRHGVTLERIAT